MKAIKTSSTFCMVVLALLTVQTGFGMYPVIAKRLGVGRSANPLVFCMIRDICCSPILLFLGMVSDGWVGIPKWRDCFVFFLLGLTGIFLGQIFYLIGVTFVGANTASIFQQMIPIWTTIIAIITCTEKMPSIRKLSTWIKLVGILLSVIGAIEMSVLQPNTQGPNSKYPWLGYLLLLLNTLSTSLYIVLQKKCIFEQTTNVWRHHPVWVLAWSYVFGSICISISSLYYVNTPSAFYVSQEEWVALVYAVIIASSLCYILLTWANAQTSATIVTAFWPFQVLPCLIGSYLLNGEILLPLQYIGAVLIIAGLFAVVMGKYLEERRKIDHGVYNENNNNNNHNPLKQSLCSELCILIYTRICNLKQSVSELCVLIYTRIFNLISKRRVIYLTALILFLHYLKLIRSTCSC